MKSKTNKIFVLVFAIAFASCTHSKITGTWTNPKKPEKTYASVFVVALTSNTIARSTVETDLIRSLSKFGVKGYKSIDEFPPTLLKDSLGKETLSLKVKQKGIDAILSISLVKKEENERYVPGAHPPVIVYGPHRHFWVYYTYWYPYGYDPGYYINEKVYYIETNFYDSATEELIWTAQSRTYNPIDLASFSKEFADMIVKKLRNDGIIQHSTLAIKN